MLNAVPFPFFFFGTAPEIEIASLNVGSRPAKRRPTGGVETLRAIPWVFAWTQTRLNLTAWLGIGPALSALDSSKRETLRDMYENLPWFTAVVDVVDRVIAMTEPDIAANYDKQLVTEQAAAKFTEDTGTDASYTEMYELGENLVSIHDEGEPARKHYGCMSMNTSILCAVRLAGIDSLLPLACTRCVFLCVAATMSA